MISPGPDFAVVSQYGLAGLRRSAIYATLGIVLALCIHVFYCVTGVAYFLQNSPKIFLGIKLLGSFYLTYLGVKMILSCFKENHNNTVLTTNKTAFRVGFLTNLLNPKATVFLLSLFSLYAKSMNSFSLKLCYAISIPLMALVWFSLLSLMLTHPYFLPFLQKQKRKFTFVMGVIVLGLAFFGFISSVTTF